MRTYSEMLKFHTFEDRFEYLKLNGSVGDVTFGYDRYLNQALYKSKEWKSFRDKIIVRDDGCDLAVEGHEIGGRLIVHHINPITPEMVENRHPAIFDPENVVCVSHYTHLAIHYSSVDLLPAKPVVRKPNDTSPWRK